MAIVSEWLKMDGEHMRESLNAAGARLQEGETELVLDFSAVKRLDAEALTQLGELAAIAEQRVARIAIRGVNVDVYRVLKTARLASCFTFLN
jgi:anti-anti-sigma regulatory factor